MTKPECRRFALWLVQHPELWCQHVYFLATKIQNRLKDIIQKKLINYPRLPNYPRDILMSIQTINADDETACFYIESLPHTGWSPGDGRSLKDDGIKIFGEKIKISEGVDWAHIYEDIEYTFALNRFVWLLIWMSNHPSRQHIREGIEVILSWIEAMSDKKDHPAWEAYSVSERIVNWLIFLCGVKKYVTISIKEKKMIEDSIIDHLKNLTSNLEYHHKHTFNNHILNNARALYIGGRLFHLFDYFHIGRLLLDTHTEQLIGENGFLKELSSHYQLLITRTYFEIVLVAQLTGDEEIVSRYSPLVKKMRKACTLFAVEGAFDEEQFPRIGDISPDVPVGWFFPFQQSRITFHKEGRWWGLWGDAEITESRNEMEGAWKRDEIMSEGWVRIKEGDWTAFSVFPRKNEIYPSGHAHLDYGSFVLYLRGKPVFTDIGRFSYQKDFIGCYGVRSSGHNTLEVNGMPLIPASSGIFNYFSSYYLQKTGTSVKRTSNEVIIHWSSAIAGVRDESARWSRHLSLSDERVVVDDFFVGRFRESDRATLYFHLPVGCQIVNEGNGYYVYTDPKVINIAFEAKDFRSNEYKIFNPEIVNGFYFGSYGEKSRNKVIRINLPLSIYDACRLRLDVCN